MDNLKELDQDEKVREILIEVFLQKDYGFKLSEKYLKEGFCDICADNLKDGTVLITSCNHPFHLACLTLCVKNFSYLKCPNCMKEFKKIDLS